MAAALGNVERARKKDNEQRTPSATRIWKRGMNLHVWAPGFIAFQGGIGSFSRAFVVALRDLGHDLRLYGKSDSAGTWQGFPLWGAGRSFARLQTPRFAAGLLAACGRERPDHVISAHLNFGPVAHLAKRMFGVPYTVSAYGIDVHEALSESRRNALRNADKVIAASEWCRRRLIDMVKVDPDRVCVLAQTVDDARFSSGQKPAHLMRRYKVRPDERVVLTVARLDASEGYKGYDRVAQALPAVHAACGPVRYIVVGKGDDRGRVETLAQEFGVAGDIVFAGFVPNEELADHYRMADVFAMPSTGEGFGIVFLEALACGTPVLAGNADGSVDALDRGRLGRLVDPNDVSAIAEGLISLLRQDGPSWWFDRDALHRAVVARFGRAAYLEALRALFPPVHEHVQEAA
jgi:glycosyltransferase involved in cell wall biosynthesis